MEKIIIGTTVNPVTFSYVNVHRAVSVNGSEPKFSASIIISKEDTKTIQKIKDAIAREIVARLLGLAPIAKRV